MKTTVKKLEPTKVKMTVTLEPKELDPYLDAARKQIANRQSFPGFRKGHVPAQVIDARLGFQNVVAYALNDSIADMYATAAQSKNLHPMDQPELNVDKMPMKRDDDQKLTFTAEVEVRPEFKLPSAKGMKVTVPDAKVTAKQVNDRLEQLRRRFSTLVGVDRAAKKGDYVNIDLTATIDGKQVDQQSGVSYQIGSGNMLEGMDDALETLTAGEKTSFEAPLAAGAHKGEKAAIEVTVNSVKEEQLPKLDDDFAKEASEFDTLKELKESVKKQAEQDAGGEQAQKARDAFLNKLEEGLDIPVPKGVLDQLTNDHIRNINADASKVSDNDKKKAKDEAEKELRDQMVLDQLAEDFDTQVSQQDVTNFLAQIAQSYGFDPNQFISSIVQQGQLGSAVTEVARSKAMVEGMRQVEFSDESGKKVDLSAYLPAAESEQDKEDASVQAASAAAAVADNMTAAGTEGSNETEDAGDDKAEKKPAKKTAAKKTSSKTTKSSASNKPAARKSTAKKTTTKSTSAKKTTATRRTTARKGTKAASAKKD